MLAEIVTSKGAFLAMVAEAGETESEYLMYAAAEMCLTWRIPAATELAPSSAVIENVAGLALPRQITVVVRLPGSADP